MNVIRSHAILALTGLDVHMLNIDLDEYLVTTSPELQGKPNHEIIGTCAGPNPAEVKVARCGSGMQGAAFNLLRYWLTPSVIHLCCQVSHSVQGV